MNRLNSHLHMQSALPAALLILLPAGAPSLSAAERDAPLVKKRLEEHVRYLTSETLGGRGASTPGLDLAAEYIAGQFAQCGLITDCFAGTPFQRVPGSCRVEIGSSNKLTFLGASRSNDEPQRLELKIGDDFMPLAVGGSGTFNAPLVFAGYGITATERGYDDYANIDAAGKAVVVLFAEPQQAKPDGPFDGVVYTPHATFFRKIKNAKRHGAAAVLLVKDHFSIRRQARVEGEKSREALDPMLSFKEAGIDRVDPGVPVVFFRRSMADRIVTAGVGIDLATLERRIDEGPTPRSLSLTDWRAVGEIRIDRKDGRNVVAICKGAGPIADQSMIVGAHYDAWEPEPNGPSVARSWAMYPGADDNASGVAVMLEIARRVAQIRKTPRRTVVFVAFAAHEDPFHQVGSKYYVDHPLLPLDSAVAMINFGMVGRLRKDKLSIDGAGSSKRLSELLDQVNRRHAFRLPERRKPSADMDQGWFFRAGIPAMRFGTGDHADHHKPTDTPEKLNYAGMRRVAAMAADVIAAIVTDPKL